MAKILIHEPSAEVRELMAVVLRQGGHELLSPRDMSSADLVVVEPAADDAAAFVASARRGRPGVSVVCVSVLDPGPESLELCPDGYLIKPFALRALEELVDVALAAV